MVENLRKNKENHIYLWDNLKVFLIFLVVLGHFTEYFTDVSNNYEALFFSIYLIHMPAFIFVSGLFSKKNVTQKRYSNIFFYLVVYLIIQLISSLTTLFITHDFKYNLLIANNLPWYMLSLFWFNLMTLFIHKYNKLIIFLISIIIGCIIGYNESITSYLSLMRTFSYYPFFLLGFYLSPSQLIIPLKNHKIQFLSVIILICLICLIVWNINDLYYFRPLITGKNPYTSIQKFYQYAFFIKLIYYIFVFAILFMLISITPNKKFFFTNIGTKTISIYAFHIYIIKVLFDKYHLNSIILNIYGDNTIYILIIMSILLIYFLSLKYFTKVFQIISNMIKINKYKCL